MHLSNGRNEKNDAILREAATLGRLLGAARTTHCKSGKDRTAMSATLEQTEIIDEALRRAGARLGVPGGPAGVSAAANHQLHYRQTRSAHGSKKVMSSLACITHSVIDNRKHRDCAPVSPTPAISTATAIAQGRNAEQWRAERKCPAEHR